MTKLKYFLQFIFLFFLILIFKLLGLKKSRILSAYIFELIGPKFRSIKIAHRNLTKAKPELNFKERSLIIESMWKNYGKIFAEYIYLKEFRNNENYSKDIIIDNKSQLEKLK